MSIERWTGKMCYIHIMEYYSEKKKNSATCDTSKPEGHYAKWNEPVTEAQTLPWSHSYEVSIVTHRN